MLIETRNSDSQVFLKLSARRLVPLVPDEDFYYDGSCMFTTYRPDQIFRWRTLTEMETVPLRNVHLRRIRVHAEDDALRYAKILSGVVNITERDTFNSALHEDLRMGVADAVSQLLPNEMTDALSRRNRAALRSKLCAIIRDDVLGDTWSMIDKWPADPDDHDAYHKADKLFTPEQRVERHRLRARIYDTEAHTHPWLPHVVRYMLAVNLYYDCANLIANTVHEARMPMLTGLRYTRDALTVGSMQ